MEIITTTTTRVQCKCGDVGFNIVAQEALTVIEGISGSGSASGRSLEVPTLEGLPALIKALQATYDYHRAQVKGKPVK